jgi:outer membrane lipopolysaccharide assembly protein LptE/RlpB
MNAGRIGHVRISLIISLLLAAMIAGCGYSLQQRANLPFDSVTIGEIKNSTVEPKLQDRLNRRLAETFMEYGVDIRRSARYRVEGDIKTFMVYPIAERNLQAVEYQLSVTCSFRLIDTETRKVEEMSVSSPYPLYFRSTGMLVDVLAEKETVTEQAMKDLSQELMLQIIYKLPKETEKKGEKKLEPKAVPAGK